MRQLSTPPGEVAAKSRARRAATGPGRRVHGVVGVGLDVLAADPDDVAAAAGVGQQLLGGGRCQRGRLTQKITFWLERSSVTNDWGVSVVVRNAPLTDPPGANARSR